MPVPMAVAPWRPRVEVTSTKPGSTRLAICDVVSIVFDVAVAFPVGVLPPWDSPMPAPAPTARRHHGSRGQPERVPATRPPRRLRHRGTHRTGAVRMAHSWFLTPRVLFAVLICCTLRFACEPGRWQKKRPSGRAIGFLKISLKIFRLTEVNAP